MFCYRPAITHYLNFCFTFAGSVQLQLMSIVYSSLQVTLHISEWLANLRWTSCLLKRTAILLSYSKCHTLLVMLVICCSLSHFQFICYMMSYKGKKLGSCLCLFYLCLLMLLNVLLLVDFLCSVDSNLRVFCCCWSSKMRSLSRYSSLAD
jgi:hypothetical protein